MNTTNTEQKLIVRAVLPNDFEIEKREKVGLSILNVALHVKEAVRVRAFTDSELASIVGISAKEKEDYQDFCKRNSMFEGIFYPQIKKDAVLTVSQLTCLDEIQDIPESKKRLVVQRQRNVSLDDFSNRIIRFVSENKGKEILPLIDLDARNIYERVLLREKVEWLISAGYTKVAVIFRGRKGYKQVWDDILPRLKEIMEEIYVFGAPTQVDRGLSPVIFPFLMGATKVSHKRNVGGGGKPVVRLLEQDWSLVRYTLATTGFVTYQNSDRQKIIKTISKSNTYNFSKWDFIVQANELCKRDLSVSNLVEVPALQKAISCFL